jgi:hypothetical protein
LYRALAVYEENLDTIMAGATIADVPKTANGAAMTADTAPVEKEPDSSSKLRTFLGILRR